MDLVIAGHFNVARHGDIVIAGNIDVFLVEIRRALRSIHRILELPHAVKLLAEGVLPRGVFLLAGVEHMVTVRIQPVYAEYLRIVQPSEFGLHDSSFPARPEGPMVLIVIQNYYTRFGNPV